MTPAQEQLLKGVDARLARVEKLLRKQTIIEQKANDDADWLWPKDAVAMTGYKPDTLRKKYYDGDVRCKFTNGRKPRYHKEDLEKLIQQ